MTGYSWVTTRNPSSSWSCPERRGRVGPELCVEPEMPDALVPGLRAVPYVERKISASHGRASRGSSAPGRRSPAVCSKKRVDWRNPSDHFGGSAGKPVSSAYACQHVGGGGAAQDVQVERGHVGLVAERLAAAAAGGVQPGHRRRVEEEAVRAARRAGDHQRHAEVDARPVPDLAVPEQSRGARAGRAGRRRPARARRSGRRPRSRSGCAGAGRITRPRRSPVSGVRDLLADDPAERRRAQEAAGRPRRTP